MELNHQPPYNFLSGALLLVNKPRGWTSFDVVNKIRYTLKKKLGVKKIKVGHSGTLDPLATGLLLICTGKYTKRIEELQGMDKTYRGEMTLGAITDSYDAETPPGDKKSIDNIDNQILEETRKKFEGRIEQVPPVYSAIKMDGKPLYKLARQGKKPKVKSRIVTIESFDINSFNPPYVHFTVNCSKGTYIRSLVHDFGQQLHCGAFMSGLDRLAVGHYSIQEAWELNELITYIAES